MRRGNMKFDSWIRIDSEKSLKVVSFALYSGSLIYRTSIEAFYRKM